MNSNDFYLEESDEVDHIVQADVGLRVLFFAGTVRKTWISARSALTSQSTFIDENGKNLVAHNLEVAHTRQLPAIIQ